MNQAFCKTKYGNIKIEYDNCMLLSLRTVNASFGENCRTEFSDKVFLELTEYFEKTRKTFDIPYKLMGTEFQQKVWRELEKIPYGTTCTYTEIAKRTGNSKAVRAVAAACGKNPIWILIPCHRVVGSGGKLTGYAGGIDMKKKLLDMENQAVNLNKLRLFR